MVLNELARRQRAVDTADPETVTLLAELKRAAERLAKLSVLGPGGGGSERYSEQLAAARREIEELERSLGTASAAARIDQERWRIGFEQVAAAMPPWSTLIGYARVSAYGQPIGPLKPSTYAYVALVYAAGSAGPKVVPLGPAHEIEGRVRAWQAATVGRGEPGTLGRRPEADYRRAGEALRRRVWDPLVELLGNPRTVFLVPDDSLNLVNLTALPVGTNEYLIERGPLIHMLSVERDLAITPSDGGRGGEALLLAVGDPDFDWTPGRVIVAHRSPASSAGYRGAASPCGGLENVHFRPLPSTASETARSVSLWELRAGEAAPVVAPSQGQGTAVRLTGPQATEAEFKRLAPGSTVLHLATHGFVLDSRCRGGISTARGIGEITPSEPQSTAAPEPPTNPLRLAGLALAGANARASATAGEEDGVLTATEIAHLDLSTVEWAVLSACDSGVGESVSGEGVFGFRRAFRIAGARTVIMSLWPVEDASGLAWMEALYEARLLHGMSTAEAVHHASIARLQARRVRNQSTHPFYWGAFVAAGDWR